MSLYCNYWQIPRTYAKETRFLTLSHEIRQEHTSNLFLPENLYGGRLTDLIG